MRKGPLSRLLAISLLSGPILSFAQGGLFNDSLFVQSAVRTTDGGYCVRSGQWPGTTFSRYDATFSPMWSKDIRHLAGTTPLVPVAMGAGPEGRLILVGHGIAGSIGEGPYEHRHHIYVSRIHPDGTLLDTKDHVLMTESWSTMDYIEAFSYISDVVSSSNAGHMFVALTHATDFVHDRPAIMKVDADGDIAWCVRYPDDALIMSRILPDEAGGCFVVLYNGSDSEHFSVVHLGPDGSTLWSKTITREGYGFLYPFHLHMTDDDRLLVVGTSDNNLMRARFSDTGALEEFMLVATLPPPGPGWGISATGSALAEDGSMTMFTNAAPPQTYRAVRTDATGAVVSAWTTPTLMEGTWTTTFNPGWLQHQDSVLTAVGELWEEESVFGFMINRPLLITTPLDLSGFCDLEPVSFQQAILPISQIDVIDGPSCTPLDIIGTMDAEVTMASASPDVAEEVCTFLSLSASGLMEPSALAIHPNPVVSGGQLRFDGTNGSEAQLIDGAGQVVQRVGLRHVAHELTVDVAPGLYLLVVQQADGSRKAGRVVVE